ncbi:hypothetical protein D9615_006676 [Tricholomella constricta]|uniref:ATP-dependent DNA helicase RecQ zinc-binding domain-containing protein n=1 Tax=Tricholomella constricta TaxID=117010 RepID=A0A8H5H739_9AGAR|nr:hypothetical protein D9615_006676 [Tricholomella constricta]
MDHHRANEHFIVSLRQLFNFAESTNICRHVSICRYFGEEIDAEDAEVTGINELGIKVCKYPEKTKRRISKLSAQVALEVEPCGDDGPRRQAIPDSSSGWRTNENGRVIHDPPGPGQRAFSGTSGFRSYGTTKRAVPESDKAPAKAKKPKVSYAPALVTKPFASTSRLSRPFKTPFKTPFKNPAPPEPSQGPFPVPEVHSISSGEEVEFVEQDDIQTNDISSQLVEAPSSTAVPDIAMELEVAFSSKIPANARLHGFNNIRRALYGVFMFGSEKTWDALGSSDLSIDTREQVISAAAKELEFSVLSMCSTKDGYTERVDDTADMVNKEVRRLLTGEYPTSVDEEDVQNVIDVMKRLSKCHLRRAGKQRAAV